MTASTPRRLMTPVVLSVACLIGLCSGTRAQSAADPVLTRGGAAGGPPTHGQVSRVGPSGPAPVPQTLTRVIGGQFTVHLTRQSFRGDHFEVLVQNAAGGFDSFDPGPVRTFVGTLAGDPAASVVAYLRPSGSLRSAIVFDRGGTLVYDDDTLLFSAGFNPEVFALSSQPTVSPGHAGSTVYEYGMGYDVDFTGFAAVHGSNRLATVGDLEFDNLHLAQIQMSNFLLKPMVQRLIIRGSPLSDPYEGITGAAILNLLAAEWANNQADALAYTFKVACVTPDIGGGVAQGSGTYTVSQMKTASGLSAFALRHEVGHNFGIADFDANCPEGVTVNCGNGYARHCGPAVQDALNHRDAKLGTGLLQGSGPYGTVELPPYAALDVPSVTLFEGDSVTLDVLGNDFDANGDALSLLSFESQSSLFGTVQLSPGTGPGGRDELIYTAPTGFPGVADAFHYTIRDSSGRSATGVCVATSLVQPLSSLSTDADTYVKDNVPHGSEDSVVVKLSSAGPGSTFTRTGWIHFDLSSVTPGPAAQLAFTVDSNDTSGTLTVWGVRDGRPGDALGVDWTETGLIKVNAPLLAPFSEDENTTLIGSVALGLAGDTLIVGGAALLPFLAADTNGEVTFLLDRNVNDGNFAVRSRENALGGEVALQLVPGPGQADATIRGGSSAGTNFGAASSLEVKNDANQTFARAAYLRFNTGGQGPVSSATLTLTPTTIQSGRTLRLRLLPDAADAWSESTITWDTAPPAAGLELTFSSDELLLNQPYNIDVTSLVNQLGNINGIASFFLDAVTQSQTGINIFASREHPTAAFRPTLTVSQD